MQPILLQHQDQNWKLTTIHSATRKFMKIYETEKLVACDKAEQSVMLNMVWNQRVWLWSRTAVCYHCW